MNYKVSVMIMIVFLAASAFAITGSIGSGIMRLNGEIGEVIERNILVKNTNNVSLDIVLEKTGDLNDEINIIDKEFSLGPGEEKKAYIEITVKKKGIYEGKVNVQFTPETGNGVGLSSQITLTGYGEGEAPADETEDEADIGDEDTGEVDKGFGIEKIILIVSSSMLILIFAGLLFLLSKKKVKKKRSDRSS